MKKIIKLLPLLAILPLSLLSCNNNEAEESIPVGVKDDTMFSSSDLKEYKSTDYNEKIDLSTLTANYAITSPGVYYFKGDTNFQLMINDSSTDKVHIYLENAHFTNSETAAIYVKKSDKVVLHLLGENSITTTYQTEALDGTEAINAAIYAKDDLTISGTGKLIIDSKLNGIVAKDDLKIVSGDIDITSIKKGIDVNDSFRMKDGNLVINSTTSTGIKLKNSNDDPFLYCEGGSIDITSYSEGIDLDYNTLSTGYISFVSGKINIKSGTEANPSKAIKCANTMQITGGLFNIDSTDDGFHCAGAISIDNAKITINAVDDCIHSDTAINVNSGNVTLTGHEGLESQDVINIYGGNIIIKASDDGINASNNILVNGGYVDITLSPGDVDGIDSNGIYTQNGGVVISRIPMTSLDGAGAVDASNGVRFNGGTFIGVGTFTTVSQITTSCPLKSFSDSFTAGTYKVKDTNIEFNLDIDYSKLTILSSELSIGASYTLYKEGEEGINWNQTKLSE